MIPFADGHRRIHEKKAKEHGVVPRHKPFSGASPSLWSKSRPLPSSTRSQAERLFHRDFADVRVTEHSELAKNFGTTALTLGNEVHLAERAPLGTSVKDRSILGHELAHVVHQQSDDRAESQTPTRLREFTLEQEANQAARAFAVGVPAPPLSDGAARRAQVQLFESGEHLALGNAAGAAKGIKQIELADGYTLSYGEIVAMNGDYFKDLDQMKSLATTISGRSQLEYVRQVRVKGWDTRRSNFDPAVIKTADDRYAALLNTNYKHFANPRESDLAQSPEDKDRDTQYRQQPRSALQAYRQYHEAAISAAWAASQQNNGTTLNDAHAEEAAGGHFLTDAFSAGHIRTPRDDVKSYWEQNWSSGDLAHGFAEWASKQMLGMGEPATMFVDPLEDPSSTPWLDLKMQSKIYDIMLEKLRAAGFGFGDMLALALHDYDNKMGLDVIADGAQAEVFGDGHLAEGDTRDLAVKAVEAGIDEVNTVYHAAGPDTNFAKILEDLKGPTGLYSPERQIPEAVDKKHTIDWKADIDTILKDPAFEVAMISVAKKMAKELRLSPDYVGLMEGFLRPLTDDPIGSLREMLKYADQT